MIRLRLASLPAAVAVALAAPPSTAQDEELAALIAQALDRARPSVLAHLRAATGAPERSGQLALLVLAALHHGLPAEQPELQAAIQKLARARLDGTYDLALRLMVLEACPEFPDRQELARSDARDLLEHRCRSGAFQYSAKPATWDLSNTQYGALGLRSAAALGVPIKNIVWRQLAELMIGQQLDTGGFCYAPRRTQRAAGNASMTAAGIAVMAICREHIGDQHPLVARLEDGIARGFKWFEARPAVIGSLAEDQSFYFHYGLERAAILAGVEVIGGVDWYAAGARMFLASQLPGGGWRSLRDTYPGQQLAEGRGDLVPTSFAVLFLRRQFQRRQGPVTHATVSLANIGPRSRPADIDACAAGLVQRGKAAMPDVVRGLLSEVPQQRQAAAKALTAIAGDSFGYDPALAVEVNSAAVRRAELWFLRNRP